MRASEPTSASKSKRARRRSSERNRSTNWATGGNRRAMCASETDGGSTAKARNAAASESGSCRASGRAGAGARGAGPSRKKRSRSATSRSANHSAASFARRYSASRRASSSAASSGSSSESSASSSGNSPRAFSSSSAATSTRNSPQASRSSSPRSASRSQNATTIAATSTSASSSSSFRTSVSNRSNGPSKASRSSSSSRTITRRNLARGPDAPARDRHGRPLGHFTPERPRLVLAAADELPPDEERGRASEDHDRDPGVQTQSEEVMRGIDPQQLLEEAAEGVDRDVEREERRRPEAEAPVEQQQHPDHERVVDKLVEESRVEGRVLG